MAEISIADILELPVDRRLQLAEAIWDSLAEVLKPSRSPKISARSSTVDSRPTRRP